jgi:hypothetical protein
MTHNQPFWNPCDHEIVPGVACDGPRGDCTSQTTRVQKQHLTRSFAATVDKVTGETDFDCVKGLD